MTTRQRVFPRAGVSQRRALVVFLFVSLVLAALCVNAYSAPATIFSDDFDHAFTGWTIKGTPDWNFLPPTIGLRSIRLRKKEAIKRTISTVGYQDITVSFYLGAWSLDKKKEYVCAEWNGGSGWQILKKIKDHDPEEDRHLHYFEYALPAGASNNAAFALRFRIHGNGNRDYGWVDEVVVQGEPIQYTLSLDGVGGAVAVNGSIQSLPWSGVFDGGEVVTLEAVPNPGFEFTGWSGDLTGADNPAAITMSSDKNVTAEFALHLVTVSAACDPSTVPSGGAADLSAVFDDSLGHSAASWHWDDGGAGGTFSPSADVQNPTYTAPENLSDDDLAVTLSVSALCDGSHPKRGSGSVTLTVEPIAHTLSVTASDDPDTVPSGGTTSLTAAYTDSRGHDIASWHWDDGGAGGSFSPSAEVQNPTYTAPVNTDDDERNVVLTVTATCDGPDPISASDSVNLDVDPVPHTLTVTASVDPPALESGGAASLTASYDDSRGHEIDSWHWDDGGAGGSFSPSADVQNPTYHAPENHGDTDVMVTLTVTATCAGETPLTASDAATLTVRPVPHSVSVNVSASPDTVDSEGESALSATFSDTHGHDAASWAWDDGGAGGSFSPSADVQNPTYTAPENTGDADLSVTLTVTATCDGPDPASGSRSVSLTVHPVPHELSVSASAAPQTVESEGTTNLSAAYTDSHGHDIASWHWDDGGAGGSFSPSAEVQNPTYTAPQNLSEGDLAVTLTVAATCDSPLNGGQLTATDATQVTVHPVDHKLTVSASASPGIVASAGSTDLSAAYADSRGHGIASWQWDDGGAGGTFSPSAEVQNPTYTAPVNDGDDDMLVTLTVTATCDGPTPETSSDSVALTVQPAPHTLSVSAAADPEAVNSGGATSLSATYADSRGHGIASWSWDDGGAGGIFSPSADVQNPTYTAPANPSPDDMIVTLTVTATCDGSDPETASDSVALTVRTGQHSLSVEAQAAPTMVDSGGTTDLTATAVDTAGHDIASWHWDDGGAGGTFSPSADVENPTYTAPVNSGSDDMTVTLTVSATCCGSPSLTASGTVEVTVLGPASHASVVDVEAPESLSRGDSASAEIVLENTGDDAWTETRGFALGPYQGIDRWGVTPQTLEDDVSPGCQATFDVEVTAPPLSTLSYSPPVSPEQPGRTDGIPLNLTLLHGDRAVEGALVETNVVISRFPDIQPGTEGEWARFYVEECAGRVPMVVQGFPEGDYRPSLAVDRAAMAVYMARSLNLKIGSYQGTFVDVPATHWAAPYIEALAAAGLVQGFDDGTYRPSLIVTRDQMAVYTARGVYGALDLPPGPDTPSFPDVPTDYWAYDAIEYAVAHGIVHGYDDGTYRPSKEVTRDQMAVYVYRAFIQSRASGVILGGPAIAASDPAADDYYGWAAVAGGPASDPGYAYVVFDAARLGAELAHDGSWDIKFELRAAAAPNNPAAGDYTAVCSLSAANIEAARNAALSSGVPYLAVSWDIPSGLAAGDYVLVVSVEDQDGNMNEVNLRPEFTITP